MERVPDTELVPHIGVDDVDIQQILARVAEDAHIQKVFGAPIEQEGVLVIPVAAVRGAGGGGSGTGRVPGTDTPGEGGGGGFALTTRAVGVYVIKGGDVHWRPAVDVNRAVLGGQILGLAFLLLIRSVLRRRI